MQNYDGGSIGVDQETNENSNIGLNITSGDEPNIGAKKSSMLTVLSNPHSNTTPQFNVDSTNNGPTNIKIAKDGTHAGGSRPQTRGDGDIKNTRAKPLLTN
jgi:hypothetical protein